MKNKYIKYLIIGVLTFSLVGCIDETIPTQYATGNQVGGSESALEALANSSAAFMYAYNYFGTLPAQEFGYPSMMLMRDALTDAPYVTSNYNHFSTPWASLSDFSSNRSTQPWRYYYRMILNSNNTIIAVGDPDSHTEKIQQFYGNALVFRAMSYMDLMRLYEYKRTGISKLDSEAEANEIYGATTVIIDEHFDDSDATNNPRVPFYHMYRFIMDDLNTAEKYLEGYARPSKIRADVSVVQALKARLWLEIATRFQLSPEDLQLQLAHENDEELEKYDRLNISSAQDAYRNAQDYAQKVISKYNPLTEAQWHSTTNGFNDMSVSSWVFAISIGSIDAVHSRVNNFYSNAVTEFSRGYSRSQYHCYRMIDAALYNKIDENDWRKVTWIDPEDQGKIPTPDKYHTLLGDIDIDNDNVIGTEWALRDAYVGFKFRPNEGNVSDDYNKSLQVDYPMIRVEEMYFIEAEAMAYTQGMSAGIDAMQSFLNTHRYVDGASYEFLNGEGPVDVDDFVDNFLLTQKRIELWGEGLSYFDIKRRNLAVNRGYPGTNWIESYRVNSMKGYTASWLNYYIPREGEAALNKAIKMNPDPQVYNVYTLWTE